MTPDGLIACKSAHGPAQTMDRLAAGVTAHGLTILARIDHAAAAAQVGLTLRPTAVLIFGNPQAGTLLMQVAQTAGIDLPLKALVWQDEAGKTWLAYNDPRWLARRHGLEAGAERVLAAMTEALESVAAAATAATPSKEHLDALLEEAIEESFPASDPPAVSGKDDE
jgi:uncharacterized protein (DUF302 family)